MRSPPSLNEQQLSEKLHECAEGFMELVWTKHAQEQLVERRIRTPHIMYLFGHAHTLKKVENTSRTHAWFYNIQYMAIRLQSLNGKYA